MEKKGRVSEFVGGPVASVVFALVSVIIGGVYYHYAGKSSLSTAVDLAMTIIVGLNFYIAAELFMRVFFLRSLKDDVEKSNNISQKSLEYRDAYMRLSDRLLKLSTKDTILYLIVISLVEKFTTQLHVSDRTNRIRLSGEENTLDSFIKFWDELIKIQIQKGKSHPVVAMVTHVDGIDLYSTNQIGLRLMSQQRAFVREGGKIFRILIERTERSQDRKIDDYAKVIERMSGFEIQSSYMNTSHLYDNSLRDINYDIFVVPEYGYSFEWDKENGVIKGCCISRDVEDYGRHKRSWDDLVEKLESYDYDQDTDLGKYIEPLKEIRLKFLAAYKSQINK
jgi:hypothetical protein